MAAINRRLRRRGASAYLLERHGIKRSTQTLAKYAVVGGGPAFLKFGFDVLYEPAALDAWVESRMSAPRMSTSAQAA